jgi:hypothetical protein
MDYITPQEANEMLYGRDVMKQGEDTIDRHNRRVGGDAGEQDGAADTDSEDLVSALEDLVEKLDRVHELDAMPGAMAELKAIVRHLQRGVETGRLADDEAREDMGEMREVVKSIYQESRGNRKAIVRLARAVDRIADMVQPVRKSSRYMGVAQLTKALVPPGLSSAEQVRAAEILKSWFGASGGKRVPYSTQLCATLRLTKSISQDQERRWKAYGVLPDWVDTVDPARNAKVEWQSPVDRQMQYFYAGTAASALVFPQMVRRS